MEDRINPSAKRCVDCLIVKKVYDACSKRTCFENMAFALKLPCGTPDDYVYLRTEFGKSVIEPYEDEPIFTERDEANANLKMVVGVPVWVVMKRRSDKQIVKVPACPICSGNVQCDNLVRVPINICVYAPREYLRQGRFEPYAESYVETGCANLNDNNTIQLSLGFFFVIKVVSDVQLKIPNFGFCEIPPECREEPCDVNFCQTFLDETATPFPQFFPGDITN